MPQKRVIITLALLSLHSQTAAADVTGFNTGSGLLSLDCVHLPAHDDATYSLDLSYRGQTFDLVDINEIRRDSGRSNIFTVASNELSARGHLPVACQPFWQ